MTTDDPQAALLDSMTDEEILEAACPETDFDETEHVMRLAAQPIGALSLWREESRENRVDGPLLTAACLEAAGLDARAAGLPYTAGDYFVRAAEVIVGAVADKTEAA